MTMLVSRVDTESLKDPEDVFWPQKEKTTDEKLYDEKIPTVDKLPFDWYDPDEDAEWEAYL